MVLRHLRRDILTLRLVTGLASMRSPVLVAHPDAKLDTYLLEPGHRACDLPKPPFKYSMVETRVAPFVMAVLGKTVRTLNRERGRAPYL